MECRRKMVVLSALHRQHRSPGVDRCWACGMRYNSRGRSTMRTVSARQANHDFSKLLSRLERGEEILITKRSKPVALLSPYQPPRLTAERQAAINHAIEVMAQGLPWGAAVRAFTR